MQKHGKMITATADITPKYIAPRRTIHTSIGSKEGSIPIESPSDVMYPTAVSLITVNHTAPSKSARQAGRKQGLNSADSLSFLRINKFSISSLHTKLIIENNLWIYIISVYSQYNTIFKWNQGCLKKMMMFVNYVDILCKLYYVNQSTILSFSVDYGL